MGEEKNSLLYVDSSSVRKARKAAENKMRASGGAAKGNHNLTSKKSVGRGLINSHMDRLEVGSDGRLFHVKENTTPQPQRGNTTSTSDSQRREPLPDTELRKEELSGTMSLMNAASAQKKSGASLPPA